MERDIDLIRRILFEIESHSSIGGLSSKNIKIDAYSDEIIIYHIKLLHQAGLIEGVDASSFEGFQSIEMKLTWDGHEFLDKIKKESIWNQAKQKAIDISGGTSLEY